MATVDRDAIAGELQSEQLSMLDSSLLTWETFQTQYPDGEVLQPPQESATTGQTAQEHYDMEPYERYSERDEFGLYGMRGEGPRRTWNRDDIDAKTVVIGVEVGDDALGFPLHLIAAEDGLVTATVGESDILAVETAESATAFIDPGFDLEHRNGQYTATGRSGIPSPGPVTTADSSNGLPRGDCSRSHGKMPTTQSRSTRHSIIATVGTQITES